MRIQLRRPVSAVVLLFVLAGCGAAATSPSSSTAPLSAASPGAGGSLFGPVWWLASIAVDGQPVAIGAQQRVWWQFVEDGCGTVALGDGCGDGATVHGHDGCNSFVRAVEVAERNLRWGEYAYSTAVGCGGPLADAMRGVGDSTTLTASVVGDQMRV